MASRRNTETTPVIRKYLSPAEAELATGISKWTWRRRAYQGSITSVKLGRRLLVPISEVERLILEGTRPARLPNQNVRVDESIHPGPDTAPSRATEP